MGMAAPAPSRPEEQSQVSPYPRSSGEDKSGSSASPSWGTGGCVAGQDPSSPTNPVTLESWSSSWKT